MSTAVVDESTFYGLGRDFTSTTRLVTGLLPFDLGLN